MNYKKVYEQIITKAQSENRIKGLDIYYERHHIIPKCLGGDNSKDNLVLLTAREHFLCHWLLIRIEPCNTKLAYAFWAMCKLQNNNQCRYTPTSRSYEECKVHFAIAFSKRIVSIETRHKQSLAMKGKVSPCIGQIRPTQSKKIQDAHAAGKYTYKHLCRPMSEDNKRKLVEGRKLKQHDVTCDHCGRIIPNTHIKVHQKGSKCIKI
jgi:hypothetical protein